jgi:putative long chain acyl-CoA synthase
MAKPDAPTSTLLETPGLIASWLRNAMQLARLEQKGRTRRTPYEVVLREPTFRLRRYRNGMDKKKRPAVILIPPLMLTADVYDIEAGASAVENLHQHGVDPWVVDFGAPERQEGGLRRTLADHILAVSRAVDRVREETKTGVHVSGYSQGGIFAYLTAAYRRSEGIASVVTFGSPVDVRRQLLPGVPDAVMDQLLEGLGWAVEQSFSRSALPPWLSRTTFRLMSPLKEVRNQIEFLTRLRDRDVAGRREGQRRFLAREGWVAWPGPALRDFVDQLLIQNRLFSGGFVVEGQTVTLADLTCAVLAFVGETDDIGRPAAVRAVQEAAPRAELYEVSLRAGHFGLVVGSKAMRETWPTVAGWLRWRDGLARRPKRVVPIGTSVEHKPTADEDGSLAHLVTAVGSDLLSLVGSAVGDGIESARALVGNVATQVPRLSRLQGVRHDTRIGLGLVLEEQARETPDSTFFLYEGRAYTYSEANWRVDAVVRGLLSLGVRQGEHVGIYMSSRPSALALGAAVSRLGAVAVFLRPDGDLTHELELGEAQYLITDPDHAAQAAKAWGGQVYVLGGVGKARKLPSNVSDMEEIDPDRVAVPEWYEASPGRAEDVAFILFSGRGDNLHANRITNRRWALAALGTASSAAMTSADTVYCWTPIQHPTGLLVTIGATLTSGARLAVANGFSAQTFWDEVRRYGASVVFYTGTMCRELVDAPPTVVERNHPLRLFAGSGMPQTLWRRLVERFGPVSVLEFYASTEGTAILANVSGEKVGSVGRPIPGSAEVAIAEYDTTRHELRHQASGFCIPVPAGEVGLLLARIDRERGALLGRPLRSVFEKGDAWYRTGVLARCDDDGDYWIVDHVDDLIRHRSGSLPTAPIEEAVWEMRAVSAAAAYGLALPGSRFEVPVVAVVLRRGADLDRSRLAERVESSLPAASRPIIARIVDDIPMTAGYRFRKQALRAAAIDAKDFGHRTLWYDASKHTYRELDAVAYARLKSSPAATRRGGRRKTRVKRKARRNP